VRLYLRAGFQQINCFGEYLATPRSLCMGLELINSSPSGGG
jgi:hypothetical protein